MWGGSGIGMMNGRRMHRTVGWRIGLTLLVLCAAAPAWGDTVFPGESWEPAEPAALGWSVQRLDRAREKAEEIGAAAVLVVQDGRVVAEWGEPDRRLDVYSIRKSLLSGLYGVYVGADRIDIHRSLEAIGFDDAETPLTPQERQATVRDLLMSRSGIYIESAYETQGMRERRPEREEYAPGEHWYYNNWDFNALGAILGQAVGKGLFEALEKRLAKPLGMQDFRAGDGRYVYAETSEHPAYPLRMTARDLARFGWLYLNRGVWDGERLIPEAWIEESTTPWSPVRSGIGYGYMWWVATGERQYLTDMGPGSWSARGSGRQALLMIPAYRVVIVHQFERTPEQRSPPRRGLHELLQEIMAAAPAPGGAADRPAAMPSTDRPARAGSVP